MANDAGVRELLKLIFGKKPTIPEEIVAHSCILHDVLNEDFSKKLGDVLLMRKFIIYNNWKTYFNDYCFGILCSHEGYLWHLMYICLYEHKCNRNVFDSLISVCAAVMYMNNETVIKVGIDFSALSPDIIMVFYLNVLKSSFPQHGGFNGFVEYIRRHKYLTWNWDENDLNLSHYENPSVNFKPDIYENIKKELSSYCCYKRMPVDMKTAIYTMAMCMGREVLTTTSSQFPILPSEYDLIKRLVASRKQPLMTKADRKRRGEETSTFETSHGDLSSNSVSKTNNVAQQQDDVARHENIIQAVIRHNHSNIPRHENGNNQKQVEAEGALEHLNDSLKSLIAVLDECNKG